MSAAQTGPPRIWWLTVFARAMVDFRSLALRHPGYFVNDVYAAGVIAEMKRIRPQIYALYAVTFVGGLVVLAGGLPSTADIEAFGVKMPATLFSQQALAVITAGLYTYFIALLASTTVATAMLRLLTSALGNEPWEFYAARFDISNLWTSLIVPKKLGYSSPLTERIVVWLSMLSAFLALALHGGMVLLGSLAAWNKAARSHDALARLLASFSLLAVVVTLLAFLIGFFVPLRYKWNGPWPPPQPVPVPSQGPPQTSQSPPAAAQPSGTQPAQTGAGVP